MSNTKELPNWTKYTNFLVLTFISTISIFYFYISAQNEIVGLIADDAVYLLMADYFSPYYSSLSQTAAFIMETSQFPPLYSISLAIFGASSENILLAHILTTSYFFGAVIIYSFWLRIDKVNQLTSHCLSLILICAPASFLMNIDLWSEHLYLLLTMCALFYVEKSHINNKYWLVASLLIGLIPLVRLVGVTFVIAYFVYLYLHKIKYRNRYFAISIIPIIIWKVISMSFYSSDIYENTLIQFYHYDFWSHIKHLFLAQLPDLWSGWHETFDIQKNIFSGIVSASILVMSLATWFSRLINKRIDSFYLLFYLIFIWVWPDPGHNLRFMFVIFPILLYYSYLSLSRILKCDVTENIKVIIKYASIFIVLVTFLPTNLYAINRLYAQVPSGLEPYRSTKYWLTVKYSVDAQNSVKIFNKTIQSYIEASEYIPVDKCVYTAHQEQFMFYARRLAFSLPLPDEVKDHKFVQYSGKCEYIHVLFTTSHPEFPGGYPIDLLEDNFNYLMVMRMSEETNSPVAVALIQLH